MGPTRTVLCVLGLVSLAGCATPGAVLPATTAEVRQGPAYGYRPLDPLYVKLDHPDGVPVSNCRILELLPDETVRLAVGKVDASGQVSYGLAKVGQKDERYVIVLDYIKSDTRSMMAKGVQGTTVGEKYVPTYVGIGLRLSANLVVKQGTVDLGNLIAIGAAAQANQVSGTLVIQTLGISGESIAAAIPIPSEISAASIQNVLVAIGTIKSKIYDAKTAISPRVVGIYNVFGDDTPAFDAFFTSLLSSPPGLDIRLNSVQCPPPGVDK